MIALAEGKILGYRHRSHILETLSFGAYVWKFRKREIQMPGPALIRRFMQAYAAFGIMWLYFYR